jgi:hypothetical protein|tara:strand:+ start:4606 stop:5718 length:1113 start_codon:yes stop_codon:yes gene_type:complete
VRANSQAELDALIEHGQELNLAGDHDAAAAVFAKLRVAAPEDPAGPVNQVATLYWRHIFDEADTRYDEEITKLAEEAVRLSAARLDVRETDAEAHYYMGVALIDLARIYAYRGRYLKAGGSGEDGRKHLERALELDSSMIEVMYPLGLYNYYSDFGSTILKLLSWLWFVPTGDATLGRKYLHELAESDSIQRWNARFILANINTYHRPVDYAIAETLVTGLHERFPGNRIVHFELIELYYESGRYAEAAREADVLANRPKTNRLFEGRGNVARIWQARALIRLGQSEQALKALARVPASGQMPSWGSAWLHLTRAQAYDTLGRRDEALADYRAILAHRSGPFDTDRFRVLAERGLTTPFVVHFSSGSDIR